MELVKDNVKNLVANDQIYRKSNSFTSFKGSGASASKVREALAVLSNRLDSRPGNDYKTSIVRRALVDLLEPAPSLQDDANNFTLHENVVEELARLSEDHYYRYLFYRYRYEIFPHTRELDECPPCLQIEVSSYCNYRCVFCYQTDPTFTAKREGYIGFMSLDLFKRIIDEVAGQIDAVTLASRGEPLACPDIGEMLRYVRGKFLASKINTNASLLTEEKCHALLESDIQTTVFSADAAVEPLYSQLRVRGNLEKVMANVRRFKEIKDRHYSDSKMITRVSGVMVNDQQSLSSMTAWGEFVDQVAFVAYNPWENTYERPLSAIDTPCSDLWRRMFIWWNGLANPCDVDYKSQLAVGTGKDTSVAKLWRSEAYEKLREAHAAKNRASVSPCNRCTVY